MFQPKLGISLHTVTRPMDQALLDALADTTVQTTELSPTLFNGHDTATEADLLRRTLNAAGIRPATVHAPFGGGLDPCSTDEPTRLEAVASAKAAVDMAAAFGAPIVVVHASAEPNPPEVRDERLAQTGRSMAEIGDHARAAGVKMAIELLPRTCLGNTVDELERILAGLDAEVFGVCLDTNHLMDRYRDLPDVVARLGSRLLTLHINDYDGIDEKHWLPGEGVNDWPAFMQSLRDIDYAGPFNYECNLVGDTPAERIQSVEKNFEWLGGL